MIHRRHHHLTVTMNSTPHIIIMVTVPTSNQSRTRTLNREVGRVDLRGNLRQHVALLPDQCGGVHVYRGKYIFLVGGHFSLEVSGWQWHMEYQLRIWNTN